MKTIDNFALQNKYNKALSHISTLTEQLSEKERAWKEKEAYQQITETLAKELCNGILSKDMGRIILGRDYADTVPDLHTMLREAIDTYKQYCKDKSHDYLMLLHHDQKLASEVALLRSAYLDELMRSGMNPDDAEEKIATLLMQDNVTIQKFLPQEATYDSEI